jgi:predicted glycosyltransferase involved in capsule biosynthesis
MQISINIPFWYNNEDRLSNLKSSFKSLRSLQKYLISNGLNVDINVFEFSEERQCFGGSIYLPIGKGYSKSIRLNHGLKWLKQNKKVDIVSFIDSDCVIDTKDYPKVLEQFTNFDKSKYYCNNLTKLDKKEYFNIETLTLEPFYTFVNSGIINGLGGMWICDFGTLYEIGGFDERYTGWGLEDEDVGKRLYLKGLEFQQLDFKVYHLPHQIEQSKKDTALRDIQKKIFLEDNTIVRPTLLNNYK